MKAVVSRNAAIGVFALLMAGCVTAPGQPESSSRTQHHFLSEDPCANNARNIGVLGGAILGALIGNSVGGGKDEAKIVGAAVGGLVGGLIGADMDRKRCELAKVAAKYDLQIAYANIEPQGEVRAIEASDKSTPSPAATVQLIGTTVTIRDKDGGAGHFESGSDQLTPKAQEYFSAIATQYIPDTALAAQTDPRKKEEARRQLAQHHILLIGHTDDTGPSQLNAVLSERRARSVAAFLRQKGVPEFNIYYQGAGETLPISDNRTEVGRAANRRVEIVEVADETGFKKYLENRKPQYAFYRLPTEVTPTLGKPGPAVVSLPSSSTPQSVQRITKAPPISQAPLINFGGKPYSSMLARLDTGALLPEKGFSLVSRAQADDSVIVADCSYDRPRVAGTVKSLRDGNGYKTTDFLPQMYGRTWAADVNGNLVVINRLTVLRNGGLPANLPELKVYAQYKPGINKKPEVSEEPAVNSYLVDKGVLYRMFSRGEGGMQCIDLLFGTDGATSVKAGKLIYTAGSNRYVSDFKPFLQ
jgi:outer membrane protein OmpA-like peptidoglycan-associated protein